MEAPTGISAAAELLLHVFYLCVQVENIMQVCEKLFWNSKGQTVKRWVRSYSSEISACYSEKIHKTPKIM